MNKTWSSHTEDRWLPQTKGEILGLAEVKGGLNSGINPNTTEIILEAANWNPITVRKASHTLRTAHRCLPTF